MSKHDYKIIVAVDEETYNKTPERYRFHPAVPQEMTAREYGEAIMKICASHNGLCAKCELGENKPCAIPDERTIPLVEQWAADHSEKKRKTYLQDFREKYPNADLRDSDYPLGLCRMQLHGQLRETKCRKTNCAACWNEEMEAEE